MNSITISITINNLKKKKKSAAIPEYNNFYILQLISSHPRVEEIFFMLRLDQKREENVF